MYRSSEQTTYLNQQPVLSVSYNSLVKRRRVDIFFTPLFSTHHPISSSLVDEKAFAMAYRTRLFPLYTPLMRRIRQLLQIVPQSLQPLISRILYTIMKVRKVYRISINHSVYMAISPVVHFVPRPCDCSDRHRFCTAQQHAA